MLCFEGMLQDTLGGLIILHSYFKIGGIIIYLYFIILVFLAAACSAAPTLTFSFGVVKCFVTIVLSFLAILMLLYCFLKLQI